MFSQKGYLIGKVKSMGIKESKDKVYNIYEAKVSLVPDNVHFTISKLVKKETLEQSSKQADFLNGKVEEFMSMVNAYNMAKQNNEDYYVSVNIKPSIKGKEISMFDTITSTRDANGTLWFQASGFPSFVIHEKDEDGNISFVFKNKTVDIKDILPSKIEVTMVVADENETNLILSSADNYPKELEVVINEEHIGKAEIGQGYSFLLGFEKLSVDDEEDNGDGWEEEAKQTFPTTILKVKKVLGKVKGYTMGTEYENEAYNDYC